MWSAHVKQKVFSVKMHHFVLVFCLFWPVIMGYRLGDTHYTDYSNHHHRGHHIRHHHHDEPHNHHGPLDSLLRKIDDQQKKDDVLSIEEASKQLQKAMDAYRKSIDAVKRHSWDDFDDKKNDDWSMGLDDAETVVVNEDDKNRGVDDGFANYDTNGVELDDRDDEDIEKMDDMALSEPAADAPHSDDLGSSETYSTVKWNAMGTPERIQQTMSSPEKTRRAKGSAHDVQAVANTYTSIFSCKEPMPVIVKISKVYPSLLNKEYYPDCVTLYMCGPLSGCCENRNEVCGPSQISTVKLQLYVRTTIYDKNKYKGRFHREFLEFRNHTRCECQQIHNDSKAYTINWTMFAPETSFAQRPMSSATQLRTVDSAAGQRQTRNTVQQQSAVAGLSSRIIQTPQAEPPAREERCRCPSRYTARLLANGECICDCFDKQNDCLRNKRGKDYFIKPDQECIRRGDCHVPSCDYGEYMKFTGKCPGRLERFRDSWTRSKRPSDFYSAKSWRSQES